MKRGDLLFEVGGRPAGVVAQMTDDELLVRRHGTITLPQGRMPASELVVASGRGMITVEPIPEAYSEELLQAAQRLRRAEQERDLAEETLTRIETERIEAVRQRDEMRTEIRRMQLAAEQRNRQLDALHVVWCDGGCERGVHRFDGQGPGAITQEIVDAAVVNTERLKRWWANRQVRLKDDEEQQS